jgi:hypothetical protein
MSAMLCDALPAFDIYGWVVVAIQTSCRGSLPLFENIDFPASSRLFVNLDRGDLNFPAGQDVRIWVNQSIYDSISRESKSSGISLPVKSSIYWTEHSSLIVYDLEIRC